LHWTREPASSGIAMEEAERLRPAGNSQPWKSGGARHAGELKQEIGGDVILLDTATPEALAARIHARFAVATTVLEQPVRIEREAGHRFVPEIVEAFPARSPPFSVSKPTLEDVFIRRTAIVSGTKTKRTSKSKAAKKSKKKH